jgi:hypothetical protein
VKWEKFDLIIGVLSVLDRKIFGRKCYLLWHGSLPVVVSMIGGARVAVVVGVKKAINFL